MPGSFFVADSFTLGGKRLRQICRRICRDSILPRKKMPSRFHRNTKRWRIMPQC